jgi:hypothetical protein
MREDARQIGLPQHAGTGTIGQEKTPTENGWGFLLVEAAGIEPASASTLIRLYMLRLRLLF